jgi:hypothetical protein
MKRYENPPELWRYYVRIIREAAPSQKDYLARALQATAERMVQQALGRVAYGELVPPESWAAIRGEQDAPPINEQEHR